MADDDATDTGPTDKKDSPAQKKQVKNEHVLIAVGVITLLVMLFYMRKSQSSSQSGTTSVANSPYGVNSYGYGAQDPYGYGSEINTLANDMQSMQSEIAGLTPPTTNSGSTTPGASAAPAPFNYASEPFQGSGYNTPPGGGSSPVPGLGGGSYEWLPSGQAVQTAQSAGTPLYYQPTPGNFQQVGPGFSGWAGTPIFEAV